MRPLSELVLACVAALALAAGGCAGHGQASHRHSHPRARLVVVQQGHAHTARCGHFRHRGRWYHVAGHVHQRGCGHHLARGVWVWR